MREIEQHLGVARSSVSRWVRDIELGEAERRRLVARAGLGPIVSGERKARKARAARISYQEEGRRLVRERGATYAAGCMLYWAEGAKHRNTVRLTNSDPELLAAFMRFLRAHFGVTSADVRIHCNLFADHLPRQDEVERYWLERLGLPASALRRSTVKRLDPGVRRLRASRMARLG